MKCIIGLGNPGPKYEKTRHNVGFMVIDELLERHNWKLNKEKYKGSHTVERLDGEKMLLLKPLTFMNLSGDAVKPLMDYYDLSPEEIVVIYDDLDLPPGKIRLRQKGGHGGHNGMRSIIDQLETKEFPRIRIGVGRPTGSRSVIDHVLNPFSKEERQEVNDSVQKAADACEAWMKDTFLSVMNEYN